MTDEEHDGLVYHKSMRKLIEESGRIERRLNALIWSVAVILLGVAAVSMWTMLR